MPLDFPTSPTNGQVYSGYVYNSTVGAWQIPDIGGSIEISATAPTGPSDGDLWWDSDDGKLYIYYDDGTSQQWVDAAGPSVAVQETPPTGYEGQLWLDSSDGSMYVYYNDGDSSQWIGAVSKSGGILQVVQTVMTSTASQSIAADALGTVISGLTTSITPISTSSKILVIASITVGISSDRAVGMTMYRNGSPLTAAIGNEEGIRARETSAASLTGALHRQTIPITFLDSPAATSAVEYSFYPRHSNDATLTVLINRSSTDANTARHGRYISTVTLMEVAG